MMAGRPVRNPHNRLSEAGRIRRDWKEIEDQIPQIIANAAAAGAKPRSIARELDVSESYVYRVIRETPADLGD
jgi:AraC-like DNA-binding protein